MSLDPAKTRIVALLILLVVTGSAALYGRIDPSLRWAQAALFVLVASVLAYTTYKARKRR